MDDVSKYQSIKEGLYKPRLYVFVNYLTSFPVLFPLKVNLQGKSPGNKVDYYTEKYYR